MEKYSQVIFDKTTVEFVTEMCIRDSLIDSSQNFFLGWNFQSFLFREEYVYYQIAVGNQGWNQTAYHFHRQVGRSEERRVGKECIACGHFQIGSIAVRVLSFKAVSYTQLLPFLGRIHLRPECCR